MYGQGNNAQFGQGSQYPKPHFQQLLIAPPHPPFQHGPPALQYSIIQQGPPSIPPHFTRAPSPQFQQGPPVQVPTTGMLNIGQSFLPPPPPQQVCVSTSMAPPYPSVQHNSQWTHNIHLPPGPPSPSPIRQEMFQPSLPPRTIPTLPSRAQASYKSPVYPPQLGGMQVSQQVVLPPPPPPPLPISNFFSPAPFGSCVYSSQQDSNVPAAGPMPAPPPPPPPSSPPPRPPPPPPPTSPIHTSGTVASALPRTVPDLSHNSDSGPMVNHSDLEVMHYDSKVVVSSQIRDEAPAIDDYEIPEGTENCEVEEDLPSVECLKPNLPPPPPKPSEEKLVQKIIVLCHFIANNGPDFEHMTRQKESGNPEFKFLFGGKPGSDAAVAHEYFEWMKEKCKSACKLQDKHSSSAWRPPGINTSTQTSYLTDSGVSHSPPDSDMDMEDDITQPDEEQQVCTSFEALNHEPVLIPKDLYIKEQVRASVKSNGDNLGWHDVSSSSGLTEQEEGFKLLSDHNHFIYGGWPLPKVDSPLTNSLGAAKCPSKSNEEESFVSSLEDLSQQNKSAAAVGIGSGKLPCQLIKDASPLAPFRLLLDYASDDSLEGNDKPCLEDSSPLKASPSTAAAVTSVQEVIGSNLQAGSNVAYGTTESILVCSQNMPSNALEFSPASQRTREINITSFATVTAEEICGNYAEKSIDNGSSIEVLQQKIVLDGVHDSTSEKCKSQLRKEDAKSGSTLQKIDEFGRIVREDSSESDSEISLYHGSRRKRQRSWSRSPSHGRRNPWRRREKRSWSRSLSPKKRRSRSRSPTYKRRGYDGEKMRRNMGQLPMCFDFLGGRCHRGKTCRYIHHDSGRSDGSRRNKSNQQYIEIPHVSRASGFQDSKKAFSERPFHEELDVLGDGEKELVSMQDAVPSIIQGKDDKSVLVRLAKSEMSGELAVTMHQMSDIKEEKLESTTSLHDITNHLKQAETSQGIASSVENLAIPISQAKQVETSHDSSTSHSSQIQPSTFFQHRLLASEAQLNKISPVQSYSRTSCVSPSVSAESLPPTYFIIPAVIPAVNVPDYHLQSSLSIPSFSQGTSTPPPAPHLPREDDLMQPASEFPSFQDPLQNLFSHSAVPPNSSWSLPPPPPLPLPPPPPFVNNSTLNGMQSPSLQFQHIQLPSTSDFNSQKFVRPYSQVTGFVGADHFSQLPVQGINPPSLYGKGSISPQPISLRMQSFPSDNRSSRGFSPQSSQNHPYSQQQQPLHGLLQSPTDSLTLNRAGYWNINHTMFRFASDLDKNQPSHLSDSGGSRISNYYNPYASTFDQPPPSSKFSSNVRQENDVLHSDQHGVGSLGSEFMTSSPKPEPADLLRLHSDQYDPLFDSIDPLSNSCMKSDHGLKHEPIDDSISLRLKGSDKPLDVEESKQKDRVLAEAASIKSDNYEYSETADAEVGDVENESESNALDAANTSAGELEINQVKMPGKRKKSEDSRSMKLFKVSLADFVKEVLKPSWRQGNMSKEAFKTIVKKTVDKVSGTIKSHQIPKSHAKISQYIDSSQRKLTKLVMGYVQKYVKV